MTDHIGNRTHLLAALRRELVGPDPVPGAKGLNLKQPPVFEDYKQKKGPWVAVETGGEVISQDNPTKRYGVGVLHPVPSSVAAGEGTESHEAKQRDEDAISVEELAPEDPEEMPGGTVAEQEDQARVRALEKQREKVEQALARAARRGLQTGEEDAFDVSGANGYRPSSMAISFLAALPEDVVLRISVPRSLPEDHAFSGMAVNGRYRKVKVQRKRKPKDVPPAAAGTNAVASEEAGSGEEPKAPLDGSAADVAASPAPAPTQVDGSSELVTDEVWAREQLELEFVVAAKDLLAAAGKFIKLSPMQTQKPDALVLSLEILARPYGEADGDPLRLITVNLVNRSPEKGGDEQCLFQAYFDVTFERSGEPIEVIHPYPTPTRRDLEEKSNALLYRNTPTFATGHGCAADWRAASPERAWTVRAECLPTYEGPSITPDITRTVVENGEEKQVAINVSMRGLAGLESGFDILKNLREVCDAYADWIVRREKELPSLATPELQETGRLHLEACKRALERMRGGVNYLETDKTAMKAFKLANHAILLQQIRGELPPRAAVYDPIAYRHTIRGTYPAVCDVAPHDRGTWRAFQIAFLLLSIQSAVQGEHPDRDVVELIWFPTGGGKTEAYLGLSAFSLFMRRLADPNDVGVHILMRYTLRLLTAQQFQRASGLICAMEYLRRQHEEELGKEPFTAGIWVGNNTTKNRRKDALEALKNLEKGTNEKNPFLITKCPWCGAQMGPTEHVLDAAEDDAGTRRRIGHWKRGTKRGDQGKQVFALGYQANAETVTLFCPDSACAFYKGLPIYTIDEDIYEERPALIIGTVDKFAMLAWRPEARHLFGWGQDGQRAYSPPGLIVQDELHLISGPLGSMSGLFEGVIEELCTDRRGGRNVSPKIVCSTATIRAYREQVRALYARDRTELFPPPGLDVSDSFFAQYARDEHGVLRRGRMYVGINGPGHGSMQTTQVRTFSSLLQFPVGLNAAESDPWWTLLTFFNSLRELGTTVTLFQSDIPDYLRILQERYGLGKDQVRWLNAGGVKELTGRLDSEEVPLAIKELEVRTGDPDSRAADVCLASNIIEVGVDIGRLSLMAIVGQPKTTSQYIQVSGRVGRRWWDRPGVVAMLYNASKPRDRSHFEKFRTYHEQLYAQVEPTSVTPFSPPALDRGLRAALVAFIRQMAAMGQDGPAQTPKVFPEVLATEFRELLLERVRAIDPDEVENVARMLDVAEGEWRQLRKDQYHVTGRTASTEPGLLTPAGQHVNPGVRGLTWMTPQSMRNVDATCEARITRAPDFDAIARIHREVQNDQS